MGSEMCIRDRQCIDPFYWARIQFCLAGNSIQHSFLFSVLASHLTCNHIIPNNAKPAKVNAVTAKFFKVDNAFSSFVLTGSIDD